MIGKVADPAAYGAFLPMLLTVVHITRPCMSGFAIMAFTNYTLLPMICGIANIVRPGVILFGTVFPTMYAMLPVLV